MFGHQLQHSHNIKTAAVPTQPPPNRAIHVSGQNRLDTATFNNDTHQCSHFESQHSHRIVQQHMCGKNILGLKTQKNLGAVGSFWQKSGKNHQKLRIVALKPHFACTFTSTFQFLPIFQPPKNPLTRFPNLLYANMWSHPNT